MWRHGVGTIENDRAKKALKRRAGAVVGAPVSRRLIARKSLGVSIGDLMRLGAIDALPLSVSTREISNAKAQAIANTHMDSRQDHLNALLDDDDFGRRLILREGSIPLDVDLEFWRRPRRASQCAISSVVAETPDCPPRIFCIAGRSAPEISAALDVSRRRRSTISGIRRANQAFSRAFHPRPARQSA